MKSISEYHDDLEKLKQLLFEQIELGLTSIPVVTFKEYKRQQRVKNEAVDRAIYCMQRVMKLRPNEKVAVLGTTLRDYFYYEFWGLLGSDMQLANQEFERWCNFLRDSYNIFINYQTEMDTYHFQKK